MEFLACVVTTFHAFVSIAPGKSQAIISEELAEEMEGDQEESREEPRLRRPQSKKDSFSRSLSSADANNSSKKQDTTLLFLIVTASVLIGPKNLSGEMAIRRMSSQSNGGGLSRNADSSLEVANGVAPKRGMVLPFTPLAMSFDDVNYYVDMPPVIFPSPFFTLYSSTETLY